MPCRLCSRALLMQAISLAAVLGSASAFHSLVIDAGSSGSRLRIFQHTGASVEEVIVDDDSEFETEPGLSSYADSPAEAGPSLQSLIDAAAGYIPAAEQPSTQLWIKATAGVRSVEEGLLQPLMTAVDAYLSIDENCPFGFAGIDILGGEEEAAFAWIAVNTITKTIGNASTSTAGVLELGGSSMQVVFSPIVDIFANKFTFYVNLTRKSLYTKSFPQFGLNDMVRRGMAAAVPHGHDAASPVDFPCFNTNYSEAAVVGDQTFTFQGTGDAAGCSEIVDNLLGLDVECLLPHCAFYGAHISPLPVDKAFYGIGAFFFIPNGLGLVGWNEAKALTPKAILEATQELCGKTQTEAQEWSSTDWQYLKQYCLGGLYAYKAFTTLGFSEESTSITFARKINGQNAGWPLGATVYETESMPRVRAPPCDPAPAEESWPWWAWPAIVVGLLLSGVLVERIIRCAVPPVEKEDRGLGSEMI